MRGVGINGGVKKNNQIVICTEYRSASPKIMV